MTMDLTQILEIYNRSVREGSSVTTKSEFNYFLNEWKYKNGDLTVEMYIRAAIELARKDEVNLRVDVIICDIAVRWHMIEEGMDESKWNSKLKSLYFVPMDGIGSVRIFPFCMGDKDSALIHWDTMQKSPVVIDKGHKLISIDHSEFADWFLKN